MTAAFATQLEETGYIHGTLRPEAERSLEARMARKNPLRAHSLAGTAAWEQEGEGRVAFAEGVLRLTAPARQEPTAPMEHCAIFGQLTARLRPEPQDWQPYNRLAFRVRPLCLGHSNPQLSVALRNEGAVKIPDPYNREGFHHIGLDNLVWNDCFWEFPDLPRDRVTELSFSVPDYGREQYGAAEVIYEIENIRLEFVEETGVSLGWTGKGISYSTSGYWTEGPKTAVAPQAQGDFALLDAATRATVLAGPILPVENEKGRFGLLDFSAHQAPGRYFLQTPWGETPDFPIGERVMEEAAWKVLHFIYRQRCGCPIPNGHGACHGDIVAEHGGKKISYSGGWHDAGDVSQQTLQTGEVAQALLELARGVGGASRGTSPLLYRRLLEEARWGLDFVLRTRFGDGFRAFSAGNARWTNGVLGDFDDEPVRCHNRSFDNFLLSGVEAYAAAALREEDPSLSWACHNAAKEDYGFARARFDEAGMESKVKMEHTYNASLSQYYAAMCWAAALLYQLEPDPFYEGEAAKYGDLLLACQETGAAGLPLRGFFYREPQGKRIVHFNHQAREHLLAQALDAVWEALPGHPRRGAWGKGLALYGEYLAALYGHAAPYGMLPAGVHALDEPEDRETFELLHLYTTYEAEYENYKAQLGQGVPLGPGHCLRQFPVWFSFRGNNGVLLSAGKAAAVCAKYGCRERLRAAARDQLYWLAGKNPFGQSMIYGEGWGYARQYTALQGEAVGEIPVGVQTRGNEDVPYWPLATNATYKEVWMTSAGHWIRLLADVY